MFYLLPLLIRRRKIEKNKMIKEKVCRFGHQCTSSCGNDKDCPCQSDHCCDLTEDCDGTCDDCSKPDLADKVNDEIYDR